MDVQAAQAQREELTQAVVRHAELVRGYCASMPLILASAHTRRDDPAWRRFVDNSLAMTAQLEKMIRMMSGLRNAPRAQLRGLRRETAALRVQLNGLVRTVALPN